MRVPQDFWESQRGMVLATSDGRLKFTRAGRGRYAARMAKHGFLLDQVTTVEGFYEVMSHMVSLELRANAAEFEWLLGDPNTAEAECEAIRQLLLDGVRAKKPD